MGNTHLKGWRCTFCGASIFYAFNLVALEDVIASHFQRCYAIHKEMSAMFVRIAEQQKANQQKKEK